MQSEIRQGVNRNNLGEIRNEDGVYKILVLGSDHYYRKRFTMAHELGHFMLHREKIDKAGIISDSENFSVISENQITQEEEKEASAYAAEILMPEDKVKEIFAETMQNQNNDLDKVVEEMSKMFQVSVKAMKLRLYLLDLINKY